MEKEFLFPEINEKFELIILAKKCILTILKRAASEKVSD